MLLRVTEVLRARARSPDLCCLWRNDTRVRMPRAAKPKKESKKPSSKKDALAEKPNGRLTAEQLGFHIRTGPDAPSHTGASMDIDATDIVIFAGKQELLYNATLRLTKGHKYGLIGRNGVGKSTLLRAIAERDGRVPIPAHIHIMHVEQEIVGDEVGVLETVVKVHCRAT